MTAPERLDDAERAETDVRALADELCAKAHGREPYEPHCQECYGLACEAMDTDWLAQRVARAVAEAKAEGWDEGYYHSLHSEPMENPYRADREAQP